jgi:hypothetical protein
MKLISGNYTITIRYRPENISETTAILRPRNEETMLKWYTTINELRRKYQPEDDSDNEGRMFMKQRQTGNFADRSLSLSNGNSRVVYGGEYDSRRDSPPITPPGSGSDDGQDDSLHSQPMSRTTSGAGSSRGEMLRPPHIITRKPAPNRFPTHSHGMPPHSRTGSLGVNGDYHHHGSYFSPADTPPVPSRPMSPYSSQQFPFPRQNGEDMGRSSSRDPLRDNGIPTPPLTAHSLRGPERQSRPSIAPLTTSRSRSASTPNIHQIRTDMNRSRELPPPLPVGRRDRDSDSPVTPHSPTSPFMSSRPTTGTSMYTSTMSSVPETPSSSSSVPRRAVPSTPSSTTGSVDKTSALKVKIIYGNDMFVVVVPSNVTYAQLVQKVRHKLSVCSNVDRDGPLRLKYQDEDDDYITISSDEDVAMAVESRTHHTHSATSGIAGAGVITLLVQSL